MTHLFTINCIVVLEVVSNLRFLLSAILFLRDRHIIHS